MLGRMRRRADLLDSDPEAFAGFGELFEDREPDASAQDRDWP